MKKVLILIIIILLIVLCYNTINDGFQIGNISVLSIGQIQQENNNLDNKIAEIEELKESQYPSKLTEISSEAKKMLSNKKTYEELVAYSSEQDVLNASQTEMYDIEVLWTRIGNHATSNGVITKMELVSSSNNTPNANDLKFTATGNYIAITDFIRDIEEDIKLGFTIEEFELVPQTEGDGSILQATFRVRDVFLNSETITTTSTNNYTNNNTEKTTNETTDTSNTEDTNK